jgi:hypothetical protein
MNFEGPGLMAAKGRGVEIARPDGLAQAFEHVEGRVE